MDISAAMTLPRIRAHIREERRLEREREIGAETRDTEERLRTLRAVRASIEINSQKEA